MEDDMGRNKTALAIIALVCGMYVIGPDPLPLAIDDIIMGLIGAANILKMMKDSNDTLELPGTAAGQAERSPISQG